MARVKTYVYLDRDGNRTEVFHEGGGGTRHFSFTHPYTETWDCRYCELNRSPQGTLAEAEKERMYERERQRSIRAAAAEENQAGQ